MILIAVFITAINISFGQSYYNSPNDTITSNVTSNHVSVFNITQVHPTTDTIHLKWYKLSVIMPATWEASICDNGDCFTSLLDSGMMIPIVPGDDGLMSLHINPKFETGIGIIRYTIFATNTPTHIDTLTWIINATGTTSTIEVNTAQPIISNSYKNIICKNLNGNFSTALLYDGNGKLLLQKNIHGEEINISTVEYSSQILILQLTGKKRFTTRFLNHQ
ncbi:MAG: hypothetical protein H0X33_05185 [Taibaiella sp.]|nr:hypothetical protein [Taibaiella sp.]